MSDKWEMECDDCGKFWTDSQSKSRCIQCYGSKVEKTNISQTEDQSDSPNAL